MVAQAIAVAPTTAVTAALCCHSEQRLIRYCGNLKNALHQQSCATASKHHIIDQSLQPCIGCDTERHRAYSSAVWSITGGDEPCILRQHWFHSLMSCRATCLRNSTVHQACDHCIMQRVKIQLHGVMRLCCVSCVFAQRSRV
eukprot:11841-Heterococcus_DN1.PRE.1